MITHRNASRSIWCGDKINMETENLWNFYHAMVIIHKGHFVKRNNPLWMYMFIMSHHRINLLYCKSFQNTFVCSIIEYIYFWNYFLNNTIAYNVEINFNDIRSLAIGTDKYNKKFTIDKLKILLWGKFWKIVL